MVAAAIVKMQIAQRIYNLHEILSQEENSHEVLSQEAQFASLVEEIGGVTV